MTSSDQWDKVRGGVLRAFGEDLQDHRTNIGMGRRELAERSLMHSTEIGLLERGQREPRLGTMLKLAVALEVPFEALAESPLGRFAYQASRGWLVK
jgi:transcriptional regulator with XRE-family HTH domain